LRNKASAKYAAQFHNNCSQPPDRHFQAVLLKNKKGVYNGGKKQIVVDEIGLIVSNDVFLCARFGSDV
jgi:hypothetical protein